MRRTGPGNAARLPVGEVKQRSARPGKDDAGDVARVVGVGEDEPGRAPAATAVPGHAEQGVALDRRAVTATEVALPDGVGDAGLRGVGGDGALVDQVRAVVRGERDGCAPPPAAVGRGRDRDPRAEPDHKGAAVGADRDPGIARARPAGRLPAGAEAERQLRPRPGLAAVGRAARDQATGGPGREAVLLVGDDQPPRIARIDGERRLDLGVREETVQPAEGAAVEGARPGDHPPRRAGALRPRRADQREQEPETGEHRHGRPRP